MPHRARKVLLLAMVSVCLWVCAIGVYPGSPLEAKTQYPEVSYAPSADPAMASWVLILVGLTGFAFMVAAVYLGLRWLQSQTDPDTPATEKVIENVTPGIAALRVGETLTFGKTWKIEALISQQTEINLYRGRCVETNQSVLIKECRDTALFGLTPTLHEMHLSHPNILVTETLFSVSTENDGTFVYQIVPNYRDSVLTQQHLPLPMDQVLAFGEGLARGLAYIHEHHVVLHKIDLQSIIKYDDSVKLLTLENTALLDVSDDDAPYLNNVRELAATLYRLATGTLLESSVDAQTLRGTLWQLVRMASNSSKLSARGCADKLRALRLTELPAVDCVHEVGYATDVGRVREVNEDGYLVVPASREGHCDVFALVADGVGGHQAGDVASRITVETIEARYQTITLSGLIEPSEGLAEMARAANQQVYQARMQANNNMGSTLVMGWCDNNSAVILNVGDSRAYRLSRQTMTQLTVDHSLVERLIAIQQITREEARMHPRRSVIYRMIGERDKLEFDLFTETFLPGEALLLCSDGLSDLLTDQQIWEIWRAASSEDIACHDLVDAASKAGGYDNITVVIVRFSKRQQTT